MKNKNLIDALMSAYFERKAENVNIAIQREDGNFDYYDVFSFNPETGSIIVDWNEVKNNRKKVTKTAMQFPKDYCIKLDNFDDFQKVHNKFFNGEISEKEYAFAELLFILFKDLMPMYMHITDGELVEYTADNKSESYYSVGDWLIIKEGMEKND